MSEIEAIKMIVKYLEDNAPCGGLSKEILKARLVLLRYVNEREKDEYKRS